VLLSRYHGILRRILYVAQTLQKLELLEFLLCCLHDLN